MVNGMGEWGDRYLLQFYFKLVIQSEKVHRIAEIWKYLVFSVKELFKENHLNIF